jgi:hypothetical protein
LQTNLANQNAINSLLSQGYSYQEAVTLANQSNQQATNLANQSAANTASATNASYYDQALTGNAQAYDAYQGQLLSGAENIYGTDLSAYLNSYAPSTGVESIINTGTSGAESGYNNIYGSATSNLFGWLGI